MENKQNNLSCAFAKVVLHGQNNCKKSCSFHVAERHGINCTDLSASDRCARLNAIVFSKMQFALQIRLNKNSLPSLKKLQMQLGIIKAIKFDLNNMTHDIDTLIYQTEKKYLDFNLLPFKKITLAVQNSHPRRRKSGKT